MNKPNKDGKVLSHNNRFNVQDGKDEYRERYREIFGRSEAVPGKWVWVDGVGLMTPEEAKLMRKPKKRGFLIKDPKRQFEVVRHMKGPNDSPRIHRELEGGYI